MSGGKKLCPICKTRETVEEFRPFCSKRCADVDLSRWLGGKYAIPSAEPPDEFEIAEALEAARRNGDLPDTDD